MPAIHDLAAAVSAWVARAVASTRAAGEANDAGDALAKGDIFGMFLTICICLIAQPSGSLFYRPWCLPIWRLNPLATLAEAVLIAYCFAVHILFVVLDTVSAPADPGATGFWNRSLSRVRLFYLNFVEEIHTLAAALLLIRSDTGRTEGTPADMVDEIISKGLLDESSDKDEGDDDAQAASQVQEESGDVDDTGDLSIRRASVSQDLGREAPFLFALRATMLPGLQPAPPWSPPLLFHIAAGVDASEEAARSDAEEPADPVADADSRLSTALRHALGASVIAHREFTVQAATVLSILSISAKLFTSSLPKPLKICGLSMLAGWIAVQTTLVIFHAGHVDGVRMQRISRKVRDLQFLYKQPGSKEINMPSFTMPWLFATIPVVYPIILLAIYCFTPSKDIAQEETVLYLGGRWMFRIMGTIVGVLPIPFPNRYAEAEKNSRTAPGQPGWPGLWGWIKPAIMGALAAYGYASRFKQLGDDTVKDEDRSLLYMITAGLTWIAAPAFLVLCLFHGTSMYPRPRRHVAMLSQGLGLLISAYLFTAWMLAYDSGGASQPSWIKWLG